MAKKPITVLHLAPPKRRGKKLERKRKNLIRLGIDQEHAEASAQACETCLPAGRGELRSYLGAEPSTRCVLCKL